MYEMTILGFTVSTGIVIPVVYLVWITVFMVVKRFLFKAIKKLASKTKNKIDDIFINSADFPLALLIFTSGGVIIEKMIPVAADAELTNYLLKHEFIKNLHKQYAKEGISIPYPIRAINYDQEKAYSGEKKS